MIEERVHPARGHHGARVQGAARTAAIVLAALLTLAVGRVGATAPAIGAPHLIAAPATSHALMPVLRPTSTATATSPTPSLLPNPATSGRTLVAWGASLLFAIAALSPTDRVRRWRARLFGAPPQHPSFRPH